MLVHIAKTSLIQIRRRLINILFPSMPNAENFSIVRLLQIVTAGLLIRLAGGQLGATAVHHDVSWTAQCRAELGAVGGIHGTLYPLRLGRRGIETVFRVGEFLVS